MRRSCFESISQHRIGARGCGEARDTAARLPHTGQANASPKDGFLPDGHVLQLPERRIRHRFGRGGVFLRLDAAIAGRQAPRVRLDGRRRWSASFLHEFCSAAGVEAWLHLLGKTKYI